MTLAVAAAACRISKKRVDCKLKEAYKLGKTLGTGGKLECCCSYLLQAAAATSCRRISAGPHARHSSAC